LDAYGIQRVNRESEGYFQKFGITEEPVVLGVAVHPAVAGAGAGTALDNGVNWIGQQITGDTHGDYSISSDLAIS